MLTLSKVLTPNPDWDSILVYSDYCEDHEDLLTANALRWLHRWDHWPYEDTSPKGYEWWVASSYTNSHLIHCRYSPLYPERNYFLTRYPEYEPVALTRASLPPEFNTSQSPYSLHYSRKTLHQSIRLFISLFQKVGPITPTLHAPGTE